MKRKLLILLAVFTISVCFSLNLNKIKAEEVKGVIYYEIKAHSGDQTPAGDYFLSTDATLEDLDYRSAMFPSTLDARVRVNGPIETTMEYYGVAGYEIYGIDKYPQGGFPVDVIKRDSQFDSCLDGHIFASPAELDAGVDGRQLWRYYCNYGGAQDKGPYYLYTLKTEYFTKENIVIKPSETATKITELTTIEKSDLSVSINATIDGKEESILTDDYEIDPNDNTVDPVNDDTTITLLFDGENQGTKLSVLYQVSDPIEKAPVTPTQTPKESPKTGYTSFWGEVLFVAGIAIASCAFIEYRKRKLD